MANPQEMGPKEPRGVIDVMRDDGWRLLSLLGLSRRAQSHGAVGGRQWKVGGDVGRQRKIGGEIKSFFVGAAGGLCLLRCSVF